MNKSIVIIENTYFTVISLRMEIINHLKKNGFNVYILSSGDSNDKAFLESHSLIVYDIGKLVSNPLSLLRYCFLMYRNLKDITPLILFTFTIRPNIFGSLIGRLLKIPVVSNVTGIGPLFENQSLVYKFSRFLYRFAFKKNQKVFFQNPMDYNAFLSHHFVDENQAKLLPGSGVDTDYFYPSPKNTNTETFTFLMISRLIKDKGVIEYIEAARIVKEKYPNIIFQILGPLWSQNLKQNTITKEQLENWENEGIITYLGQTYDVRPFIAASDCIVLPSYREGNANVLMQGGSMEKPLIASDVIGCNNLIVENETGFLVEVKSSISLANAMIKMIELSDERRNEMGKNARNFMKANYPKSAVLNAYEEEILRN
jgi:glycosyltransferase involved in cell wall biosynthesis